MALRLNIFSIFSLLNFHSESNAQTPQLDLISFALSCLTSCRQGAKKDSSSASGQGIERFSHREAAPWWQRTAVFRPVCEHLLLGVVNALSPSGRFWWFHGGADWSRFDHWCSLRVQMGESTLQRQPGRHLGPLSWHWVSETWQHFCHLCVCQCSIFRCALPNPLYETHIYAPFKRILQHFVIVITAVVWVGTSEKWKQ